VHEYFGPGRRWATAATPGPLKRITLSGESWVCFHLPMTIGVVTFLKTEKGRRAISSPDLPDGADAFVHFSAN
jgi:hypothetical protein